MGDTDVNDTIDTPRGELAVLARPWTRAPFFVLGAAWLGSVPAAVYLLWTTAARDPLSSPYYGYLVFGGAVLTLLGFVTGAVVWVLARRMAGEDESEDVGRRIWLRALGTTSAGVLLWWIGLLVLDLLRTAR
jgi:hypothetical protein